MAALSPERPESGARAHEIATNQAHIGSNDHPG
jgi:hypothetical protein